MMNHSLSGLTIACMFCLAAGCGDAATGSEPVAPETDTQAQVDATITPDDATTEVDGSAGPDDTESTAADTQSDSSTDTSTDEDTEDSVSDDADGGEQGDSSAEDVIDERFFAQENTGLSTDYVFKGVWAGANGEMVLVGNAGAIARRSTEAKWSMLAESTEGASLLNAIAWYTLDDDAVKNRDLEFAMAAAKAANDAAAGTNPAVLDTLARAYFEVGDMDRAIRFQRKAVEKCGEDDGPMCDELKTTLKKYEDEAKSKSA